MSQFYKFAGITGPTSVIICAYTEQRWEELVKAIQCTAEQVPAPAEIILVIDHNPSLLERAASAFPRVRVIPNRELRGLSGARNSGVQAARGDILVFMDEDAWPEAGWLVQLQQAYANPDVLGAGGLIEPEWVAGRPAWFPPEFDWVVGCTYRGMPTSTQPVRNLIGANMSFRRSAFTSGPGFRQGIGRVGNFPAGCEETEFSIRIQQTVPQGFLLYIPTARVHHRVPPDRARWSYFAQRCFAEGQSKALVAGLVGAQAGLGSERTYTLRTLPVGVIGYLSQALRGDLHGVQRALTIVAGLFITTAGYLTGRLRNRGVNKANPDEISVHPNQPGKEYSRQAREDRSTSP